MVSQPATIATRTHERGQPIGYDRLSDLMGRAPNRVVHAIPHLARNLHWFYDWRARTRIVACKSVLLLISVSQRNRRACGNVAWVQDELEPNFVVR